MKSAVTEIQKCWQRYGKNKTGEIVFSDYNIVQNTKSVFHEMFSYYCKQGSFASSEVQDESETLQDDAHTSQCRGFGRRAAPD